MNNLKNCPFCGKQAFHHCDPTASWHRIWCGKCGCALKIYGTEEEAFGMWNTRTMCTCSTCRYLDYPEGKLEYGCNHPELGFMGIVMLPSEVMTFGCTHHEPPPPEELPVSDLSSGIL